MRRHPARITAALILIAAHVAIAAERDICENRSGEDLVRCIEASARGAVAPAPLNSAPLKAIPDASKRGATVALPPPAATVDSPRPPPEDCTGRTGETLRRCLAAGGRLAPSAAVVAPTQAQSPEPAIRKPDACDEASGDALRQCIESAARLSMRLDANRRLVCTGYATVDQPLCVHRNTAITECQNRKRYPDFEVCLRSQMARAPQPKRADCSKVSARARGHCEARNRVFERCIGDKYAYFACLARHLGTDAILGRR